MSAETCGRREANHIALVKDLLNFYKAFADPYFLRESISESVLKSEGRQPTRSTCSAMYSSTAFEQRYKNRERYRVFNRALGAAQVFS